MRTIAIVMLFWSLSPVVNADEEKCLPRDRFMEELNLLCKDYDIEVLRENLIIKGNIGGALSPSLLKMKLLKLNGDIDGSYQLKRDHNVDTDKLHEENASIRQCKTELFKLTKDTLCTN